MPYLDIGNSILVYFKDLSTDPLTHPLSPYFQPSILT